MRDLESSPDPFTENSKTLNPNLKGREIREAFKEEQYQILLVANKFQTGCDQPLLCGMYIDKRLDGIQAVQTLSRLNRAYPGKDTTYVLDFVNEPDEILKSFQTYYTTATLSGVTDPNIVLDLRSKIDAMGHYEDYEVNRVVSVELDPNAKQAQLIAAITPVADRLLRQFKAARAQFKTSTENKDSKSAAAAKDQMDALILFRSDMASYLRLYAFLSQIFNYENTEFEKRSIFFKRLIPLLKFEREREGVDLSSVVLTYHHLKNLGKQQLSLPKGEYPKLPHMSDVGSGMVRDKHKVYLSEIIERANDVFKGELTENDKLVYVNDVLLGKLLESNTLIQQALNNSKEQFSNSPDLDASLMDAIIDALDAHNLMSNQALSSESTRSGLKAILLGPARLYETLRASKERRE